jgi:hypothetical protein
MDRKPVSPFPLRLEPDLRKVLEDSARLQGRSLQAEIVARLHSSTGLQGSAEQEEEVRIRRIALELIREELARSGLLAAPPEHEPGFHVAMKKA